MDSNAIVDVVLSSVISERFHRFDEQVCSVNRPVSLIPPDAMPSLSVRLVGEVLSRAS
jgi:hypothetical protein